MKRHLRKLRLAFDVIEINPYKRYALRYAVRKIDHFLKACRLFRKLNDAG